MRQPLALIAIAALAAAWCVPAGSEERVELPAEVICSPQGQLVGIRVLVPRAGIYTLQVPPDVCSPSAEAPAHQPRPPASSARLTV